VLLANSVADRVLANDVVILPARLADSVPLLAHVSFINRPANRLLAILEDGVVAGTVANVRVFLDHGLVTDAMTNGRQAALFLTADVCRIPARTAVAG
jgi:hypothetical protein